MDSDDDNYSTTEHLRANCTADEISQIQSASTSDTDSVDALIKDACSDRWQKVALIVGKISNDYDIKFPNLPFFYIHMRMRELAKNGILEFQGNIFEMRESEIRLRNAKTDA